MRTTSIAGRASGGGQAVVMTYDNVIEDVVRVVEAVGAGIMVVGGAVALVAFVLQARDPARRADAYPRVRRTLGRTILLGLEVLIIGDIVRTIIVEPTIESVGVLGLIVVIRIVLSFSLEIEMEGTVPWRAARAATEPPA
jgi:uncharacterized membrane protein